MRLLNMFLAALLWTTPGGKCGATVSWDGRHRSTTWGLSKHQLIKIVSLLLSLLIYAFPLPDVVNLFLLSSPLHLS